MTFELLTAGWNGLLNLSIRILSQLTIPTEQRNTVSRVKGRSGWFIESTKGLPKHEYETFAYVLQEEVLPLIEHEKLVELYKAKQNRMQRRSRRLTSKKFSVR